MSADARTPCPSCGAMGSGSFCGSCGSARTSHCTRCGAARRPGDRFCGQCGAAAAGSTSSPGVTSWVIGGIAAAAIIAVLVAYLVRQEQRGAAPPDVAAAPVQPPDLSSMSPKERFDRLYNRVMQASESGDQAVVAQFMPMAVAAYGQLDTVDADARYHLAMLMLHTGQAAQAAGVADSLLAADPGHLFGYMILGTVARWDKNEAGLKKAQKDFLAHYGTEEAKQRPEYSEHKRAVEDFKLAAEGTPRPRS